MTLLDKFASRQATIGIVGLGYVGLPLAVVFAEAGFQVRGVDPETIYGVSDDGLLEAPIDAGYPVQCDANVS